MAVTKERERQELEAGLEQQPRERLEGRPESNRAGILIALACALVLAVAALLVVVLKDDSGDQLVPGMNAGQAMPGPGHMTGGATGGGSAAAAHTVNSVLGDYWIRPDATTVKAGDVTFTARNDGQIEHELMVERAPIKMDAPGQPNEEAAQGMIEDMEPGESGSMTLNLKPGMYALFCNVPGHYAAGQQTMLRVTAG